MTTTIEQNINWLLELAELLRTLKATEFTMGQFAPLARQTPERAKRCGMACCIGGWATAVHPELVLGIGTIWLPPTTHGHKAFAEAFGVTYDEAFNLCHSDAPHQTPKAAADAVERLAAKLAERNGYEIVEVA